jgi:hypothetical protein
MFAGVEDEALWRKANERPFLPGMRLKIAAPIEKKLGLPGAKDSVTKMRRALVANVARAVGDPHGNNSPSSSAPALPSAANPPSRRTFALSTRACSTQRPVLAPALRMPPSTPTSSLALTVPS